MSKMRPELGTGKWDDPTPTNGTAYLMILNAIEAQKGLIAGHLRIGGDFCSIGAYFNVNKGTALQANIIDEVAMVNDSFVNVTPRQRKLKMQRWLRWKLTCLGMPGFKRTTRTRTAEPTTKA